MPNGTEWPSRYEEVTHIVAGIAGVAYSLSVALQDINSFQPENMRPEMKGERPDLLQVGWNQRFRLRIAGTEAEIDGTMKDMVEYGLVLHYPDGTGDRATKWRLSSPWEEAPYQISLITDRLGPADSLSLSEAVCQGVRFYIGIPANP